MVKSLLQKYFRRFGGPVHLCPVRYAGYAAELAESFSLDTRKVMESRWYREVFPRTRLARSRVGELKTTKGGRRLATSVEGSLTGFGADYLIIDDPLKPDDALSATTRVRVNDWFSRTAYTRLNNKAKGTVIVVMQRLHEDDLSGSLLQAGGWEHLCLPAIAEQDETHHYDVVGDERVWHRKAGEALHPAREPLSSLEVTRRMMGEYGFAGQYQQSPAPQGGGLVKRTWFRSYADSELPNEFELVLQSWDTANKDTAMSDYSVCTTWRLANDRIYLLHVLRKKLNYPELKRAVIDQANYHKATTVLIEDKSSGTQLIQELSEGPLRNVKGYKPNGGLSKQMRMHAQTGMIENGKVFLPDRAEWLDAYMHELTTFPAGKHDDQVDSTAQALQWIAVGREKEPGIITYYRNLVEEEEQCRREHLERLGEHDSDVHGFLPRFTAPPPRPNSVVGARPPAVAK